MNIRIIFYSVHFDLFALSFPILLVTPYLRLVCDKEAKVKSFYILWNRMFWGMIRYLGLVDEVYFRLN